MYRLYFVLVLSLGAHGTAEESLEEKTETLPPGNVRNGDRSPKLCLRRVTNPKAIVVGQRHQTSQLVESLLERVERQEIRLQQMQKTMEENVEALKRKDIRIGHLERELDEMKTAWYRIQSPVDKRQKSEERGHDIGSRGQDLNISFEDHDPSISLDSSQEQHKSKNNGITSRQKTQDEQPMRSGGASPVISGEVEAFRVSLSKTMELHPGLILKYDEVPLDVGGNYNKADGVYIVPVSGVYVFTWITTGSTTDDLVTELVVNGSQQGVIFSDPDPNHWDSSTGLIVTSVSVGDHVFIRSKQSGTIYSGNTISKAMFSGWRLS